jgi:hypothetical protein
MNEPMCSVCAGTGDPGTGKPCICGGRGTQTAELQGFREYLYHLERERDRLLVLATKHCPKEHHDWQELLKISVDP